MAYRVNMERRNGRDYAKSLTRIEERDTLVQNSRRKLNSFSRSLNEDELEEVLGALNSLADLLKGKRPEKERGQTPSREEHACDCDPKQPGCDCHNEDDDEDDTPKANAIVRGFKANSGDDAAQRHIQASRKRENSATDRSRLIRNALGQGNASFLDDDDIVAIAKRRR